MPMASICLHWDQTEQMFQESSPIFHKPCNYAICNSMNAESTPMGVELLKEGGGRIFECFDFSLVSRPTHCRCKCCSAVSGIGKDS